MAHGVELPQGDHLPIVPGGAQVEVVNFAEIASATTNDAGGGLRQAPHLLGHFEAVVGGHGYPEEARGSCPTGR